jgi:hypothetical protein
MHVIGAMKVRLYSHMVPLFAFVTAIVRIDHALFSTQWHIEGDMGIPWLMANDWENTANHRFYWGQDYLGTYETAVLAKVGHFIWGNDGTIPIEFNFILGQLLYVAGATALFAAVRRVKPKFGEHWWEFLAAVALLGFAVPSMAKFSFSVGTGYSLTPLVLGLCAWLWAKESALQPGASKPWVYIALGVFAGLAQTVMRLNVLPVAALAVCLAITRVKYKWPVDWKPWALFAGGFALGALPELTIGVESGGPGHLALFPVWDRFERFFQALFQTGNALGTLPYRTVQPEDALYWRGHGPEFPHLLLDLASFFTLGALAWYRRKDLKSSTIWIFWIVIALNILAITFNPGWSDFNSARRYEFPGLIAISVLILLSLDTWIGRGLATLRGVGLLVYLFNSLAFNSPLQDVKGVLDTYGFNPSTDCLSGSGGDVTTVQALSSVRYTVISHKWRLLGNYSRAIDPSDLKAVEAKCRKIFHVDTGETPIEEVGKYCPGPTLLYREPGTPRYRPAVRLFGC